MTPPPVPTRATLTLHDGEEVECLIEQVGPREWQATPIRDVDRTEVAFAFVDVLPGGAAISYVLDFQEDGP